MQYLQKKVMAEPTFQHSALQEYVVDANDVMHFKLVREEKDLDNESLDFAPEMCHQVPLKMKNCLLIAHPNSDLWRQREHFWVSGPQNLALHDFVIAPLICPRGI